MGTPYFNEYPPDDVADTAPTHYYAEDRDRPLHDLVQHTAYRQSSILEPEIEEVRAEIQRLHDRSALLTDHEDQEWLELQGELAFQEWSLTRLEQTYYGDLHLETERDARFETEPLIELFRHLRMEQPPSGRPYWSVFADSRPDRIFLYRTALFRRLSHIMDDDPRTLSHPTLLHYAQELADCIAFAMIPGNSRIVRHICSIEQMRHRLAELESNERALSLAAALHPRLGVGSAMHGLDPGVLAMISNFSQRPQTPPI